MLNVFKYACFLNVNRNFQQGRQLLVCQPPSDRESTLKGKHLLPIRANSSHLDWIHF